MASATAALSRYRPASAGLDVLANMLLEDDSTGLALMLWPPDARALGAIDDALGEP